MTRSNNVCYIDDDKVSRWDRDRKRDNEDRLMHKIKADEEKERNDKFNFWIYVAFIVLGIILLVVIIYSIVSLFQKKDSSQISIQQQQLYPPPPPIPVVNKPVVPIKSSTPTSLPPSILKKPSIFDKTTSPSPSPSPSPSSIPFPSIPTQKVNKGFLSTVNDNINKGKTETKTFISSFLSPIVERNITRPVVDEVKKGGYKKMIKFL